MLNRSGKRFWTAIIYHNGRSITRDELLIEKFTEGETDIHLAKLLGVCSSAIKWRRSSLRLSRYKGYKGPRRTPQPSEGRKLRPCLVCDTPYLSSKTDRIHPGCRRARRSPPWIREKYWQT